MKRQTLAREEVKMFVMGLFRRTAAQKAAKLDARRKADERRRALASQRALAAERQAVQPRSVPSSLERAERAVSVGVVHRSEYLAPEQEKDRLKLDDQGLPTGRLVRVRDRLLIEADRGGWVNPKSTQTYRLGIFSFQLRGSSYYASALKAGRFTPGSTVRLVREPANVYDPNAVAVYADKGRSPAGYVNKTNAKRIASLLDSGVDLVAISTRGAGAGADSTVPYLLVCERRVMAHLRR